MNRPIEVCAAVILHGGRLLLATRPPGKHLAGKWEFPGGKVKTGETLVACIIRELQEELGLPVRQAFLLFEVLHQDPEHSIRLHFLMCSLAPEFVVQPREGQISEWFEAARLPLDQMAPADRETIVRIRQGQGITKFHSVAEGNGLPCAICCGEAICTRFVKVPVVRIFVTAGNAGRPPS